MESPAGVKQPDPTALQGDDERIAFWVNAYNDTVRTHLGRHPVRGNLLLHFRLFNRARCEVKGLVYSANQIEHGLLRGNRRPPLNPRRTLRSGDPRLAGAPSTVDPRVHFALNCGARSCPPIRRYEASSLEQDLDLATRAYLEQETSIDQQAGKVMLPYLMRLYRADFGGKEAQLSFAAAHLPELADWGQREHGRVRIRYRRFDWTAV